MDIYKALITIFREPKRAYSIMPLSSESILHLMLDGALADIMRVRRYLEAECAVG